jgi:hypothetical protein
VPLFTKQEPEIDAISIPHRRYRHTYHVTGDALPSAIETCRHAANFNRPRIKGRVTQKYSGVTNDIIVTTSGGQTASPHRTWIQGHRNQQGLLDAFDDDQWIIVGAVKVTSIGDLREWDYEPGSEGAAGRGASWTRSPRS